MTFRTEAGGFDSAGFAHAVRLWTMVLEISVLMAQFPSERIAERSYRYRTLGLGYANLGGLLMASGLGYDSDGGRAYAARAITALMTGTAYRVSAEMARTLGPFPGYADQPRRGASGPAQPPPRRQGRHERLRGPRGGAGCRSIAPTCRRRVWPRPRSRPGTAPSRGPRRTGFETRRSRVVAPTGTIGLVMDCDTTGT